VLLRLDPDRGEDIHDLAGDSKTGQISTGPPATPNENTNLYGTWRRDVAVNLHRASGHPERKHEFIWDVET
jgi:hypothetical protein